MRGLAALPDNPRRESKADAATVEISQVASRLVVLALVLY